MSSSDTFALCQSIVLPEYFDPEYRNAVSFIKEYFNKYNTTPKPEQIEAETNVELQHRTINKDEIQYTADQIETFCKRSALKKAVLKSPELINQGDFETVEKEIRDAILISLNRDLGLRYFEQVDERLERLQRESNTVSTGWTDFDELLYGGLSFKELALVAANSGGGKSITLANLGYNFLVQGYNVLYISLELDQDTIGQRYDTMFTGVSRRDWKQHVSEISTRVKNVGTQCGVLDIVQLAAGSNANDIRAYLKEFYLHYDMLPDVILVDYLDEMSPNEKISADNIWLYDKFCARELRQIMVDYNAIGVTASQLNREAVKAAQHDHSHIAGGISKINIVDVFWTVVMTSTMQASGDAAFHFQKTRNSDGVGNTVWMHWDGKYLRLTDKESTQGINFKSKKEAESFINDSESILSYQNETLSTSEQSDDSASANSDLQSLLRSLNE